MKKTLFAISAIAVLLGFTACTSENEILEPQVSGKTILKAYTEEATRTALSGDDETGYKVVWSEGDKITVGDKTFTLKEEDGGAGTTSGTFTGDELTNGTEYTAYYPTTYDGTNWPTAQTYTAGNITGSPMKATFTYTAGGEEPSLAFKNEGGILRLNLKGEAKVTSIKIGATGLAPITLDCGSTGVELNTTTATPFHIAVPGAGGEGNAYSGLKIMMTDDAGKVCTKTAKSDIIVKRSEITDISLTASSFAKLPNYLCFTAGEDDATVGMAVNGTVDPLPTLEYSTDLFTWTTLTFTSGTSDAITLANVGDKVYFRSTTKLTSFSTSSSKYVSFNISKKVAASGNVMSLIDPTCQATTIPCNYCFSKLFSDCTGLTTAPALPATTLTEYCYYKMFNGCTGLTAAPELPATTLAASCYEQMFYKCTSLTAAPELPATTLAKNCYYQMFEGCTSLTAAPELPAETLAASCYQYMFYGCTKLNSVTCLATNISASKCVYGWLDGVATSGTFTKAASMTSWPTGTSGIPSGWTVKKPTKGTAKATINGVEKDVKWIQLWENGPKFAEKNVGASSPEDDGDYYAWGETETKENYSWSNYKWCNGTEKTLTKYCTYSSYGTVDNKMELDLADDAAYVNWGSEWRMPTAAEMTELLNCTWTWTTQGEKNGFKVMGSNGNSIFLPAAGYRVDSSLYDADTDGYSMSSSLYDKLNLKYPNWAWNVNFFNSGKHSMSNGSRCYGYSVRPVLNESAE